jgi:ribosomal-protein-alanine N-acetyltransferase
MNLWWFPATPVTLETASLTDAPDLAEIHAACFAHDWSAHDLENLIAEPLVTAVIARRIGLFGSRRIVGFLLLRAVAGEAEVLTIAVDPRRRGEGLGRQLMRDGMARLAARGVSALFLEVDEHNAPALGLYRSLGFREVGRRAGYYARGGKPAATALVLRHDLG